MSPTNNNFWVLYKRHTEPNLVECEEEEQTEEEEESGVPCIFWDYMYMKGGGSKV